MNGYPVQRDRPVERHIEIGIAVDTRGVDVDVVTFVREGSRKPVHRANRAAVADRGIIGGDDVQYAQRPRPRRLRLPDRCAGSHVYTVAGGP